MSTLIFGDSFIGPFSLINDNNIKLYRFKGGTMKGLGKIDNKNRKAILKITKNMNTNNCMIFNFGQVDLHFSYYYDRYVKKTNFMMKSIIETYIKFINSLNCDNCNKIVLAVYPNPISDNYVFKALISYNILTDDIIKTISKDEKEKVSNYLFRYNLYVKFNTLLEKYCKLYKLNFINLGDVLLDKNKRIYKKFKDPISDCNIHLLWEPLIEILIPRLLCCNIKKKYKNNLKQSYLKFIKCKKKELKEKVLK